MDEKELIYGNLVSALNMLENAKNFIRMIPEVRTNIVFALSDAKSASDVAGIEGRITIVNGYPKAAGLPKFGASSHMARLVIEAMKINKLKRAGINFMYNDEFGKWLVPYCGRNGYILGRIDRSKEPEENIKGEGASMPWKVAELIRSAGGKVPDIGYETGAVGKEPVSILLGTSAVDVVNKVLKLTDEYIGFLTGGRYE
jgi:predicted fused transcriptional regulator/phosphomethylpyrimidine kinase